MNRYSKNKEESLYDGSSFSIGGYTYDFLSLDFCVEATKTVNEELEKTFK